MTRPISEEMDFDHARGLAERAVEYMMREMVPPTPNNFSVWFHYCLGTPPDLKRTIDILVANKRKFDTFVCSDLLATYIGTRANAVAAQNVSEQLDSVMGEARKFLAAAIEDNRSNIEAIGNVVDQTVHGVDPTTLIEGLMGALSTAVNRASMLEVNFSEASVELDTIRNSLKEAEERAKTDTLTGLANRRALEEFFRAAQIGAMEVEDPLSILMADIDHFKGFNDTYGHGMGDQVIRLIASVLREQLREGDLPARYGGEELIAVLPRADLATCHEAAERIRNTVAGCRFTGRHDHDAEPDITVSIGVAEFRPGESMADLIARCDRALYKAKALGRNRTVTETGLAETIAA